MQLNFDRLLVLSVGFMLLFTSFGTAQSLAGQVLQDNSFGELGFYSLSVLYLVFGAACFVSLPVVKKLGAKACLVIGALCYTVYVSSFILPAFRSQNPDTTAWYLSRQLIESAILIAAAINGFGASILWVAQGQYISNCANNENKGQFNSVFWALFMAAGIVGNLMAAYVIVSVDQSTFYIVITFICIASSLFFLLLRKPNPQPNQKRSSEGNGPGEEVTSVMQDVTETFRLMVSKRMLKLTPLILWTALSQAIISSVLVPLMTDTMDSKTWSPAEKNKYCLLSLVGQGTGEILGAILHGYVQDTFSDRVTCLMCMGLSTAACGVEFAFVAHFDFTLWFGVIMCFCWGV